MTKQIRHLLILVLISLSSAWAGDDIDQNEAQALRDQGRILPLDRILVSVKQAHPGRIMEVELEKKHDRYIYEIELVDNNGKVWEMKIDAATGSLLSREEDD